LWAVGKEGTHGKSQSRYWGVGSTSDVAYAADGDSSPMQFAEVKGLSFLAPRGVKHGGGDQPAPVVVIPDEQGQVVKGDHVVKAVGVLGDPRWMAVDC
jgi:hypothetical protein